MVELQTSKLITHLSASGPITGACRKSFTAVVQVASRAVAALLERTLLSHARRRASSRSTIHQGEIWLAILKPCSTNAVRLHAPCESSGQRGHRQHHIDRPPVTRSGA
jgi:hypothetical protein